jgi:hypothetical protein
MNRIAWWLVDGIAQRLDPEEREAALGDIVEARDTPQQALANVFGLVARRHLALWKGWRPWLAFVLAFPSSLLLMGLSVSVSLAYQKFVGPVAGQTVYATRGEMLGNLLLLLMWSGVCGFMVASVSRRTIWASALVALIPCLFCLSRFRIESLSPLSLFLFLAPGIWGLRRGLRVAPVRLTVALGVAFVLALLTLPTWGPKEPWGSNRFLIWPAWYLILVARKGVGSVYIRRQTNGK